MAIVCDASFHGIIRQAPAGYLFQYRGLNNSSGLEMFIHQWWAIAHLRIKSMTVHGDSTLLTFHDRSQNTIRASMACTVDTKESATPPSG
ncbi:hypothetical protein FEF09_29485 [Chitinophaga pinensis]|uniref:GH141-like insertion domain-containing protein n=2 Tax=Chitinophaga pinensis TaxID=79329 RepID=A0A5C6LIK1_9BACT|nr:hypothetical protein [Chitinophaga pinensis]TWV90581.1 hypothetical protein FEF09_29485 [Chitinophaga pinensis]